MAGIIAFAVVLGSYLAYLAVHPYDWTLDPVDLGVYRSGGLIVRHVRPWYNPHLATPLYDWPGYENLHLKFTYPPFAALVFAVVSLIPWRALPPLSVVVNIAALLAALWFTFGGLGLPPWPDPPGRHPAGRGCGVLDRAGHPHPVPRARSTWS